MSNNGDKRMQHVRYSLAAKATIHGFVFVPDVTSQTGGGGKGALTLVTRELLQSLHTTRAQKHKGASHHL